MYLMVGLGYLVYVHGFDCFVEQGEYIVEQIDDLSWMTDRGDEGEIHDVREHNCHACELA